MLSKKFHFFIFRAVCVLFLMLLFLLQINELDGRVAELDILDDSGGDSHRHESDSAPFTDCSPVTDDILWVRLKINAKSMRTRTLAKGPSDGTPIRRPKKHYGPSQVSKRRRRYLKTKKKVFPTMVSTFFNSSDSHLDQLRRKSTKGILRRHKKSEERKALVARQKQSFDEPKDVEESTHDFTTPQRATSWQCRLTPQWKKMPAGTFPTYLQTGKCRQTKCMEELYECTPKRYSVKILRRIPNACFPLPVHGRNSSFEEAWTSANYNVVVGCECTRKRSVGTFYSRHSLGGDDS